MTPETYYDPSFSLTSPAFAHEETIPIQYTGVGEEISPPLVWRAAPSDTRSFALIVYDPDAPHGDMTHWVLFNIPGNATELPEVATRGQVDVAALPHARSVASYIGIFGRD